MMFTLSNDDVAQIRLASANDNIDAKIIRLKAEVLEAFIKERKNDPNPDFQVLVETAAAHAQMLRHSLTVRKALIIG